MDFIVLDWTRMGKAYCIAGAIVQAGQYRIVRPQLSRHRHGPVSNPGWSPFLLDGHSRWEVFELLHPEVAHSFAPHLEDIWVQTLQPCRRLATRQERCAVLQATLTPAGKPLFGVPATHGHAGSFVEPGKGERSLATILAVPNDLQFTALWRDGSDMPDIRVSLILPEVGRRILPVKDHFLLARAEKESQNLDDQLAVLARLVRGMGPQLAVRIGLSRSFPSATGQPGKCWLMADGFFCLDDPQS